MEQFITILLTVVSGTLVYSIGRLIELIIIKPLEIQRQVIGRVAEKLVYNANLIHNPGHSDIRALEKAYLEFRELSGLLRSSSSNISLYWLMSRIPNTRAHNIDKAAGLVMYLSNGPYSYEHYDAQETHKAELEIKKLLKINRFNK